MGIVTFLVCKKIALIGYGKVGKTLVNLLSELDPEGKTFTISAIGSRSLGLVELDQTPTTAVNRYINENVHKMKAIEVNVEKVSNEIASWLNEGEYDIIVEATISNYETGGPALRYIQTALEQGKDAVTCNKAPIALAFDSLQRIASESGALIRYESTVMDGTPVISVFRNALPKVRVEWIRGIFNSTVNVVIDSFYEDMSLEQGIERAIALDVAEEDPSLDLNGEDAAAKLVILINTLSDLRVQLADIEIQPLTQEAFESARTAHQDQNVTIRQLATADIISRTFQVRLEPVQHDDILYGCRGTSNAAVFALQEFGELVIAERNPTLESTAFGVYSDLMDIHRSGSTM